MKHNCFKFGSNFFFFFLKQKYVKKFKLGSTMRQINSDVLTPYQVKGVELNKQPTQDYASEYVRS